jgi:hypothetical protein
MTKERSETRRAGLAKGLKAACSRVYGALKGEWLAKLRLKDHYMEKRSRS